MGFTFNGNSPTAINFNNKEVTTLQFNGVTVWQKLFDVLKSWTSSNWSISSSGDVDTSNTISSSLIRLGVCDYAGGVYSQLTAKSSTFDITNYKTLTISLRRNSDSCPTVTIVSSNKTSANLAGDLPVSSNFTTKTLDVSSYTGNAYIQIQCVSAYKDGEPDGYQWGSCDCYINKLQFT